MATNVKIDGRVYEYNLAPQLLELDGTDPGARARRDTAVLREIVKYNPAVAEGQLEWGTDPESGDTVITVSRQAKTKGQRAPAETTRLNPVLVYLSHAPQRVPPALTLVIVLKALELNRRLDAPTLLAVQSRIQGAKQRAQREAENASRVYKYLASAQAAQAPWEPPGF